MLLRQRWKRDSRYPAKMEPVYHVSPLGGFIFCRRKGVKAAGKTVTEGWCRRRQMIERELEGKWGVEKLKTEGRGDGRWKDSGMELEKQPCVAGEQKRGREWEAEKEVKTIDSPSGKHFLSRCINPHLLTTPLQPDTGTQKISTAEYKPVKSTSATEQHMHYCGVLRGFWQAWNAKSH